MSEQKTHIALRFLKVLGWTVLLLAILVIGIRYSLKTAPVHNFVKNQAVSIGNEYLNGTLSIEKIEGDLWKDFSIRDLEITSGTDTLIQLQQLSLTYDVWDLFGSTFTASDLKISGLYANIREEENGEYNLQNLLRTETPEDTASTSFGINLQHVQLQNSSIDIWAPSFLPDSSLRINELNAAAGLTLTDEISASLSSLSFRLREGRLPEPISLDMAGSYQNEIITLNQLVLGTGGSLVRANARSNLSDSTLTAEVNAQPFSLSDFESYLGNPIPDDELQLSLQASGRLDSLNLELTGDGTGFDELLVISNLSLSETPALKKFGFSAKNINLAHFTNDSVQAQVGEFQATVEGHLPQNPEEMNVTWGATAYNIQYEGYILEILFGSGTIIDGKAQATIQAKDGNDEIITGTEIEDIFEENPAWNFSASFDDINLGWWLRDPNLNTDIHFNFRMNGSGFELSDEPWEFAVSNPERPVFNRTVPIHPDSVSEDFMEKYYTWVRDTVVINGQKIANINIEGNLTRNNIEASGFLQLLENKIDLSAAISDFTGKQPSYNFTAQTRSFDAREVYGVDEFPTSINLKATGEGSSFDPESIRLSAQLFVDSSFVNGAPLDSLGIEAQFENNILQIPAGTLRSDLVDGSFSARRNIYDPTDPQNDIALDLQIKNLQPLASLMGATVFNASGQVTGNITNEDSQQLRFDGDVALSEIQYDTLFSAEAISGSTNILIGPQYGYDMSLEITEPAFNGFNLEDIRVATNGIASPDSISGAFNFDIVSTDAGQIAQAGNFHLMLDSLNTNIRWHQFDFQTPARTLTLKQPFHLSYQNAAIQTDTLKLQSEGGTYLNLSIPHADSLTQEIWTQGHDFDFGVIQEIIFDERFVDGVLSGNLSFYNSPDRLAGNGTLDFTRLSYQGVDIDTLDLNFDLQDERLSANLSLMMDNQEKVYGNLDIPFVPADPGTLSDEFFEESVSGELAINPVQLSEFQDILSRFNITETDGILGFHGKLSGTAGEPNMEGSFKLEEPTLSGVRIDSAFAEFKYHHQEKTISALAEIDASGQKAAQINATLPISMDFRTFEFNMPDENDSLHVNMITDNFNISVFNDFLNTEYTNRLRGILNAEVDISGPFGELAPSGFMTLHGGQLGIPIAGITLTSINSELRFTDSGLDLQNFSMRSGNGTFTANGQIELDGITPSDLDIRANASRFRAANTDNYNLTVDLNSRLSGDPLQPTLSGQLVVKNGFIFLQDFGERSVESVTLEDEEVSTFSPYDSLSIDMRFVIERNFLVRNRRYLDMEVALTGELDAQKQAENELELFGSLTAERGYARPLGKQFNLDEGSFTFSGPITEPELFIRTSYIPQTAQKQTGDPITLFYIIEGDAQDPTFRFESEPFMEQQDIICYTLFNKPCYALESWQQVVSGGSGSSPTDLLVDVLLDEVEILATQQLGIDVVQIDNSGVDGKTSIKTGWYLNRRTFFAIINEISGTTPETLFILEYILNDNLDVVITQGDDNRQGIDLRWQYDY